MDLRLRQWHLSDHDGVDAILPSEYPSKLRGSKDRLRMRATKEYYAQVETLMRQAAPGRARRDQDNTALTWIS
jgi:hypothetical protein